MVQINLEMFFPAKNSNLDIDLNMLPEPRILLASSLHWQLVDFDVNVQYDISIYSST